MVLLGILTIEVVYPPDNTRACRLINPITPKSERPRIAQSNSLAKLRFGDLVSNLNPCPAPLKPQLYRHS